MSRQAAVNKKRFQLKFQLQQDVEDHENNFCSAGHTNERCKQETKN